MKIEAEGGELILRNSNDDVAIIPKDKVATVKGYIKDGNNEAIDELISTLPYMEGYAEDGSLIPIDGDPPKGETTPYLFVDNKDDERYRAYNDSLSAYNTYNKAPQFGKYINTTIDHVWTNDKMKAEHSKLQSVEYGSWDLIDKRRIESYNKLFNANVSTEDEIKSGLSKMSDEDREKHINLNTFEALVEDSRYEGIMAEAEEARKRRRYLYHNYSKDVISRGKYVDGQDDLVIEADEVDNFKFKGLAPSNYVESDYNPTGTRITTYYEDVELDTKYGKGSESHKSRTVVNDKYDPNAKVTQYLPQFDKPKQPVFVKGSKAYDNAKLQEELGVTVDGIWGKKSQAALDASKVDKKPSMVAPKDNTNFEKRFNDRTLNIDNGDGTSSSHKMMSFEVDGKQLAAPTIIERDGKLVELSNDEAMKYALSTGEYKEFNSEAQAQAYAEGGYKRGTNLEPIVDKTKIYISNTTPMLKVGSNNYPIDKNNEMYKKLTKDSNGTISGLTQKEIDALSPEAVEAKDDEVFENKQGKKYIVRDNKVIFLNK